VRARCGCSVRCARPSLAYRRDLDRSGTHVSLQTLRSARTCPRRIRVHAAPRCGNEGGALAKRIGRVTNSRPSANLARVGERSPCLRWAKVSREALLRGRCEVSAVGCAVAAAPVAVGAGFAAGDGEVGEVCAAFGAGALRSVEARGGCLHASRGCVRALPGQGRQADPRRG
jgi:hypothetical protein